jgi:hypothetical protein
MQLLTVHATYLSLATGGVALNLAARKMRPHRSVVWTVNAALLLAAAAFISWVSEPRGLFDDFRKAYYPAGRLIFQQPYDLYSPDDLRFVNVPVVALAFVPFSALPYWMSGIAFTLAGLVAVFAAWVLLVRVTGARGWRRLALLGVFALNGPLYYSLREGNATHFVLPLMVLAVACLDSRREVRLGALLALAGLIKPLLLLLPVYFALRRRWRVVGGCAAVLGIAGSASLLLFGVELHRVWLATCIGPFASRPMTAYNVQSLGSVVARLFTDGSVGLGWRPVEVGGAGKLVQRLLLACLAGPPLVACLRRAGPDRAGVSRLEFCMVLCLAVLTSTVSWTHYYLFLLVPAGLWLGGRLPVSARPSRTAAFLLALALTTPPVVAISSEGRLARLLASHCWAGGALVLALLTAARWQAGRVRPALRLAEPAEEPAPVPLAHRGRAA